MATQPTTPRITNFQLLRAGACPEQRRLFRQTFGTRADVTRENVLLAIRVGLSLDWVGHHLLNEMNIGGSWCDRVCMNASMLSDDEVADIFVELYTAWWNARAQRQ